MSGTDRPYEPTQRLDPGAGYPETAPGRRGFDEDPRAGGPAAQRAPGRRGRGRGRIVVAGIVGALLGFVIALVVVALGTSDRAADPEAAADAQRIEALEAELAARDARIDEQESRVAELESRLAEAEAAAGERAEDVEAQRRALDERAAALDERTAALDGRASALDEREAAIEQREAEVAERERAAEAGETDQETDEPRTLLPDIDEETIIERVLEQLRDLFQRS